MTLPEHHLVTPALLPLPEDMTGEAICALCAARGTCCCATEPSNARLSFPLSLAEWRGLAPFRHLATLETGLPEPVGGRDLAPVSPAPSESGDVACVSEENSSDFLRAMASLFPGEGQRLSVLFPAGGRHFRLRTRSDGSCAFLGRSGCRLPREARPWYCLLFPGWVQGSLMTLFMSEHCLAAQHAQSPAHGLKLMGMTKGDVFALYRSLRRDWGL